MTRLNWGVIGERFFEGGVDRGVLYVGEQAGVPWIGLVSVNEASAGSETKEYYIDGVKYATKVTSGDFEATIEAYTYPEEFGVCDGTSSIGNGLFVTHQRRMPFGFAYRTKVGNDIDGIDHTYKLHIVYEALAEPSERANQTLSDSVEPLNFSWRVVTTPPIIEGFKPSGHFVIDARKTPGDLLQLIENILYGSENYAPRLPTADELAYLFKTHESDVYDAEYPGSTHYFTYDGGSPSDIHTLTFDGGSI